ncbi:MAG: DUF481 domain-containing protein [Gammaproteobacteria bacterium]|nr:DUF481 domain-containing protein [Gammaproteobacteria bacterium]MYF02770.1 DUF481 domain-containing protein [Gammaproteobacteria bacterium]MYI77248.1 DUF481 domain-containing protein [Gammaproteobacteria bacterium]
MLLKSLKYLLINVISIFVYLSGNNVIGDTLRINNGDVLSGELVGVSGNVVTFETDYAGTLYISQKKVDSVVTEADFTIVYVDGSKEIKALSSDLDIEQLDVVRRGTTSVLVINTAWKSQLTISLAGTSGNNESRNFSMFSESSLLRSKSEQLLNVSQTRESTDAITTTDLLDVKYNFRWLRSSKWYTSVSVDYSYDPLNEIAWTTVLGIGGGKKFIEHSLSDLSMDVAVSAVYQSLDEFEEVSPALRVASVYRKKMFGGRVELIQQNRLLWITEKNSGVIDGLFGLRFLLSNALNLDFRNNVKYETDPAKNSKNTNLTYSVGIGVSF